MLTFLIMVSVELESDDVKYSVWDRFSLILNSHDLHTIVYLLLTIVCGGLMLYYLQKVIKRHFAKNKID